MIVVDASVMLEVLLRTPDVQAVENGCSIPMRRCTAAFA
jgi:hypothetical protein